MNIYEKIINNQLELLYLKLICYVKDKEEVIDILYKSFEKLFVSDFQYTNLLLIKDRFLKNVTLFTKKVQSKFVIDNNLDYQIDERLYAFNFNFAKYFNEVDNKILIAIVFNKVEIRRLAIALNYDERFILNRYITMMNWIKTQFVSSVKAKIKTS